MISQSLKRRIKNSLRKEKKFFFIIFSRNRACQLDLLLRSLRRFCNDWYEIVTPYVIYKYDSNEYLSSYIEIINKYSEVIFVNEKESLKDFKRNIFDIINNLFGYVVFFVDDIFCFRRIDLSSIESIFIDSNVLCYSLRLGENINLYYIDNNIMCLPSKTFSLNNDKKYVIWTKEKYYWGYPMSLDGHVFRSCDIIEIISLFDFDSPNLLESSMDDKKHIFYNKRELMVFEKRSSILNIPINRVQNIFQNKYIDSFSAIELNKKFLQGYDISIEKLLLSIENKYPCSCHEERNIELTK